MVRPTWTYINWNCMRCGNRHFRWKILQSFLKQNNLLHVMVRSSTYISCTLIFKSLFRHIQQSKHACLWSIEFSKTRRPPHHVCLIHVGRKLARIYCLLKLRERAQFIQKLGASFIQKMWLKYIFKKKKIMPQGGSTAVRVYIFLILPIFRH